VRSKRLLLAAPGLALAAAAVAVALEVPSAGRLQGALQAGVGVILMWAVAVAVQLRYPDRPLGRLLFVLAGIYAIPLLVSSPDPLLYTLARAARPAVEVLLIWVMLAFPSGRLQGRREMFLVWAAALDVLLLWVPGMMLSPNISLPGVYVYCHPDCPRNVLFVADWPEAARALHIAFRAVGAAIYVATAAVLIDRLRQASSLMRRTLAPVVVASLTRILAMAAFLVTGGNTLAITLTLWAVPLAIALGLLRGRLYTAKVLQRVVGGLQTRPDMHALRDVMATALGDASLAVAYWMKDAERWVNADGEVMALPYPTAEKGRAVTLVQDAERRPLAALIHDVALLEEPMLLDAVAGTVKVALESQRMDVELAATRAKAIEAVEEERHRIERDLHDGAQQRLIALRMKLSVASRLLDTDARRLAPLLEELGADVETAMKELREFSRGIAPPVLVEQGLAGALKDAAQRAAIPTRVEIEDVGRLNRGIECAVYFCCLEALQNAAKHAGPTATARLALRRDRDTLRFSVSDDGSQPLGAGQAHSIHRRGGP